MATAYGTRNCGARWGKVTERQRKGPALLRPAPSTKGETMYEREDNPSQGGAQHPGAFSAMEQPTSALAKGEADRSAPAALTSSPQPAAT
jgi:hypothetical protein